MKMKKIKIKLFKEELDTINKANGKEVSIYENEDIEIIINYENIEKRIEEINLEMTELAQEKIKLENELEK